MRVEHSRRLTREFSLDIIFNSALSFELMDIAYAVTFFLQDVIRNMISWSVEAVTEKKRRITSTGTGTGTGISGTEGDLSLATELARSSRA